jgi:hypothetical protein
MKRRIISAIIYAASFLALGIYCDAVYGAGAVTRYLWLIRLALCGTAVFALACVSSLFSFRVEVIAGLAASGLTLPYFGIHAIAVPWGSLLSVLRHSNWPYSVTAILVLTCSAAYSLMYVFRQANG